MCKPILTHWPPVPGQSAASFILSATTSHSPHLICILPVCGIFLQITRQTERVSRQCSHKHIHTHTRHQLMRKSNQSSRTPAVCIRWLCIKHFKLIAFSMGFMFSFFVCIDLCRIRIGASGWLLHVRANDGNTDIIVRVLTNEIYNRPRSLKAEWFMERTNAVDMQLICS